MPVLDWIFITVLVVSLLLGAWRGLVFEVVSVLSWIAAFILAPWFAPDVAARLPMSGAGDAVQYAAAFVLLFIAVVLAGGLLATVFKKLFAAMGLRPADRALGAIFGLLRGLILLLAMAVVIGMTPLRSAQWWQASVGAGVLSATLKGLQPLLPAEFGKYLMP